MRQHLAILAIAVGLVAPWGASARQAASCGDACGVALRSCLQAGRPALRECLRPCKVGERCADCEGGDGSASACVAPCREARRREIHACVRASTQCSALCRTGVPAPTPTATPRPAD